MSNFNGKAETIEIYWDDLTSEKQKEILAAFGENCNYDVFPIAVIPIEEGAPVDTFQEKKNAVQMEHDCPLGGDIANDCDGCANNIDYHYDRDSGRCVSRGCDSTSHMTSNYLLIEVIEREIFIPEEYKTFEQAQEAMFQKIAEAIGEEVETIREAYLAGRDIEHGAVVLENMAYCESHGQNYDWMIFTSDGGEWRAAFTPAQ